MKNFISVSIPNRKIKKLVLENMLKSVNMPLNEKKTNYGIFEGIDKNIILKLEIPSQLSERQSDKVAYNLSSNLFELGYKDFDIEISTNKNTKINTLENTSWTREEVNDKGNYKGTNIKPTAQQLARMNPNAKVGSSTNDRRNPNNTPLEKPLGKPTGKPTVSGIEPGSKEALMAIVTQYAKPGMTLADVNAMETAAVSSEVPSANDDANIFSKAFAGFKRFAKSKSWRVQFVLANAAEQSNLPGLFTSKDKFVFMKPEDNSGDQYVGGGPSTSSGSNMTDLETLAKVGLVPQSKLDKVRKAWSYNPKMKPQVDRIIAAQNAATAQAPLGDSPNSATDDELDAMTAVNQAKDRITKPVEPDGPTMVANKFADLDSKAATTLAYEKLKRLKELLDNNPEARAVSVEESKKILRKKLYNNYIFEDATVDKEVSELVSDLKQLLPKLSPQNQLVVNKKIEQSIPYTRRHSTVSTSAKADKKPGRLNVPGNPLADFSKSGKGGLANDPDEQLAIDELQRYLGIPVTGKYDQTTRDAVTAYQKQYGLKVDGDAGPETIGHMVGNEKPYKYAGQGQDNNPNRDGGQKSEADQRKADAKKDPANGVAPPEEQEGLDKVIKFNWKKKSYYIDVNKIEVDIPENKIVWLFYKDADMKNPQKVDILAKYWVLKIEAELVRRGETDSLKIVADFVDSMDPTEQDLDRTVPDRFKDNGEPLPPVTGGEGEAGGGEGTSDSEVLAAQDTQITEDIFVAINGPGTDDALLFKALAAISDNAQYRRIDKLFKKDHADELTGETNTLYAWMLDDLDNVGLSWLGFDSKANLDKFMREMKRLGIDDKKLEDLVKDANTTGAIDPDADGGGETPMDSVTDGPENVDRPLPKGKAAAVWNDEVKVEASFINLEKALAARNRLKEGDMVLIGQEKALVSKGEKGELAFLDKDGNPITDDRSGGLAAAATVTNKNAAADETGGETDGPENVDKPLKKGLPELSSGNQEKINIMADKFWEAGKPSLLSLKGATDEKMFAQILGDLSKAGAELGSTAEMYAHLDKAFKALEKNNKGSVIINDVRTNNVSLEQYARSEMNSKDMEKYFYGPLKGKNISFEGKK